MHIPAEFVDLMVTESDLTLGALNQWVCSEVYMMIYTKLKLKNISILYLYIWASSRKKVIRNQWFERVACLVQTMQRFKLDIVFSTNLASWQQMLEFSVSLWVEGVYRSHSTRESCHQFTYKSTDSCTKKSNMPNPNSDRIQTCKKM